MNLRRDFEQPAVATHSQKFLAGWESRPVCHSEHDISHSDDDHERHPTEHGSVVPAHVEPATVPRGDSLSSDLSPSGEQAGG